MAASLLCNLDMSSLRLFLLTCCLSLPVLCQLGGRSTITAGIGGGFPTGGENVYLTGSAGIQDGAAFSGSYEFRLFKYFAPEVGVVNLIPLVQEGGKYPEPPVRQRVTLLSLAARGILPLKQGRIELFAGAAAVHVSSTIFELNGFGSPTWLGQINGGGRFAIDRRRHFWIGPTVRFSRDGGRPTEEWVSLTGDFGFRF
jgi:hypothetical protein